MDINQKELFMNQYPNYIANHSHDTYEEARKGCNDDPKVKTIKFVRAPEEPEIEDPKRTEDPEEETTE